MGAKMNQGTQARIDRGEDDSSLSWRAQLARAIKEPEHRTLYGFKHEGAWRVPRFQFYDGRPMPGVSVVFPRLLNTVTPVAVEAWFTTPTMELVMGDRPVSPRDWLLAGGDPIEVGTLAALL